LLQEFINSKNKWNFYKKLVMLELILIANAVFVVISFSLVKLAHAGKI